MDLSCPEILVNDSEAPFLHLKSSSRSTVSSTCSSTEYSQLSTATDAGSEVLATSNETLANDGVSNINKFVYLYASATTKAAHQQPQPQQQQQPSPHSHSPIYLTASTATGNLQSGSKLDHVNKAIEDPTFKSDRCLEYALKLEHKHQGVVGTYFMTVQRDITPPMRKIVAEWMMEVCAEVKCQEEVVLLALNYMDRFLSTKSVRKTHLQILAAACLLLASKLREPSCRAFSVDLLVFYTDNSIHKDDLIKWELYVLSRLGWDLSSVTPLDFLKLLIIRLPIRSKNFPDSDIEKVRQHAQAFISLAAKEHDFAKYTASTIAASSIVASMSGLRWHLRTGQKLQFLLGLLTDLTSVEQDLLQECMVQMETIFEEHSRKLQPFLVNVELQPLHQQPPLHSYYHRQQQHQQQQQFRQATTSSIVHVAAAAAAAAAVAQQQQQRLIAALPDLTQTCKMQAQTQNELQDIKF